jgi:hypothetical protein
LQQILQPVKLASVAPLPSKTPALATTREPLMNELAGKLGRRKLNVEETEREKDKKHNKEPNNGEFLLSVSPVTLCSECICVIDISPKLSCIVCVNSQLDDRPSQSAAPPMPAQIGGGRTFTFSGGSGGGSSSGGAAAAATPRSAVAPPMPLQVGGGGIFASARGGAVAAAAAPRKVAAAAAPRMMAAAAAVAASAAAPKAASKKAKLYTQEEMEEDEADMGVSQYDRLYFSSVISIVNDDCIHDEMK